MSATFSAPMWPPKAVIDVHPSASSSRLAFVDLARAGAVLMMLQGHTLDVVLATELRAGAVFDTWTFLRGLTSCTFLLISGFVFTLQTQRRGSTDAARPASIIRRLRRYGFLLIAGYALHFPAGTFVELAGLSDERWHTALVVDVLHCVAVTLLCLQGLSMLVRTRRSYGVCVAVGCAVIVALTPVAWDIDWSRRLPGVLAAYLSPATGSLFPVFPWSAYIWFGAWLAWLHLQSQTTNVASFANRALLGGGGAMLVLAYLGVHVPLSPSSPVEFWSTIPFFFLLRGGLVLLILAALVQVSRFVKESSSVIRAVAQESLTIYIVHLCLVYGSAWNIGLQHLIGPTQMLQPALAWVGVVWGSMILLAVGWHTCKHRTPRLARWLRIGVGGLLVGRLLLT